MDKLQQSVTNFTSLEERIADGTSQLYHKVVACMHDLCFHILEAEKRGVPREEIEEIIKPARDIHSRSVFVKRLQEWPREYPGDFETIEYICDLENRSTYGKVEYYIEEYAMNSAMAQQHRNKLQYQSELILDTLSQSKNAQKILSVGCGGCRDILKVKKYIENIPCDIVLYDIDNDALDLSRKRLEDLQCDLHLIDGNFLHSVRKVETLGPFDLIIAGGLFDYLSDKHLLFFLKNTYRTLLSEKGVFFFTNIQKENPFQVWQEYFADWKLTYRTEENILGLLSSAGFTESSIDIKKDGTGLTFLVTVTR
ncbi:MAG: class I SAM-dependent methyltransferase [Candidatus Aenigmarchaeota archaeon]|nr:class I SAM-dependent methyltransferase [Candidatus Aenigmarchaeota archaeon]